MAEEEGEEGEKEREKRRGEKETKEKGIKAGKTANAHQEQCKREFLIQNFVGIRNLKEVGHKSVDDGVYRCGIIHKTPIVYSVGS